jgi:hypothetical protein
MAEHLNGSVKPSASVRNLLDKRKQDATFRDELRWEMIRGRQEQPLVQVARFLGTTRADVASVGSHAVHADLPNLYFAMESRFPDWKREDGPAPMMNESDQDHFEIAPRQFAYFMTVGYQFFRTPSGSRRVLAVHKEGYSAHLGQQYRVVLLGRRDEQDPLQQEMNSLKTWMASNHYLSGQVIDARGNFIGMTSGEPEDVILPPETEKVVWDNTLRLFSRRPIYEKHGLALTRGVLLYGPPGNGKTMIGKRLARESGATFIWYTPTSRNDVSITELFALARKVRPAIIFLEDLDFYASRRGGFLSGMLGELLAQMDGLKNNDGIIVVATTNDVEAIEPALKDRPSRFDVVVEIGPPILEARRRILARWLSRLPNAEQVQDWAASASEGLSGAQVKELALRVLYHRLEMDQRGELFEPTKPWLDELARSIEQSSKRAFGFGATPAS